MVSGVVDIVCIEVCVRDEQHDNSHVCCVGACALAKQAIFIYNRRELISVDVAYNSQVFNCLQALVCQ